MSISITGLMTNDASGTFAAGLAAKKSEEIRDTLINLGVSQNQITVGAVIGNQSENSSQIKTSATFNVPNLPINKSQIINLNQ